jgi:LPS O-antigen subunit length determinant protein (WzzB/FepE family)
MDINKENMEMQQIMEMLAKIKAERKADQEKADANTKAMQELQNMMKADRENLQETMNANTKALKEKTDALVANIKTACQYAMETSLKNMKSNPE